uniref:DUF5625 domain-containing protein n=2 Tax=Enterobacter asburiae TaxID=61645 RepID=A0A455W3U9_ENTAS|nr:hypothetical protein MRY18106EAS_P0730 [Enterobacter asburiae]
MIYKMKKLVCASALIWSSASVLAADFSDREEYSDVSTAETLVTFQAPADFFEFKITGFTIPSRKLASGEAYIDIAMFEINTKVPRHIAFRWNEKVGNDVSVLLNIVPGTGPSNNIKLEATYIDYDSGVAFASEPTTDIYDHTIGGSWEVTEKMVTNQKGYIKFLSSHGVSDQNVIYPGRYIIKLMAAVYNP